MARGVRIRRPVYEQTDAESRFQQVAERSTYPVNQRNTRSVYRRHCLAGYPLLNRLADVGQTFARWMLLFPNIARVRRENLHAAHPDRKGFLNKYLSID